MLHILAQADYSYEVHTGAQSSGNPVVGLIYLILVVLMIVAMWKVFQKAGKPGWASIVPFYNSWVSFEIGGKAGWWSLIPFANVVMAIIVLFETARRFGKGTGFGFLMLFLPFVGYPILAFGDARYNGSPGATDGQGGGSAPVGPASSSQTPPSSTSGPLIQ